MLIIGNDNETIEIKIIDYEFPKIQHFEDGNWLQIYFKIKNRFGQWQTTNPCLMTWDVERIIRWLKKLAGSNKLEFVYEEFLEPNVSFYLMNKNEDEIKQIKIQFDLDQFSNDFNPQPVNNDNEYSLIFNAECKELLKLAGELQVELDQFPVR